MNLKKKLMVIMAAGIVAISASPLVLAATPQPADNDQQAAEQTTQTQEASPVTNNVAQATDTELTNDKYLTKGGAAFWFIFTIVLNGVLSFWIGNRFYRLARKDNHVTGEIRALRRDIENKFVNSVGGFAEQDIDIKNLNESLAMDNEGIKPQAKSPVLREVSAEEEERFRKWEEAQSKPKTERARVRSAVREELDDEFDDVKRINRKNYQPKRERTEEILSEAENDAEDLGATKEIKINRGESVKSKAKEILGDIFPFKED